MGPAATAKQEQSIASIRARLAPSDDDRFRVELALAYGKRGKQRVIDAWQAIANGERPSIEGFEYIETTGFVVERSPENV